MEPFHLRVTRQARYFLSGATTAPVGELWLALHGHAQLASRFLRWLTPLEDGATLIAAPEALSRFYLETRLDGGHGATVGATWLTREDREAELADVAGYLDQLTHHLRATYRPRRFGVLGFSQGAVVALRWLAAGGPRPDRVVLWGVPLPTDISAEPIAARLGDVPLGLVAGDRDPYAVPGSIEADGARLAAAGVRVELRRFPGGHEMPAEELQRAVGRAGST